MLSLLRPVVDIALVCSDFDASLHFYRDLLGLEVAVEMDIPAEVATGAGLAPRAFHHARLRAGETLIKLMQIDEPPAPRTTEFAAGVRWLTFIVADVPALYEQLGARGVPFVAPPVSAPDAQWVVCAVDPDGLLVEFVQP